MSYVIAAPCVADYSCVSVCPVDAISPRPTDSDFDEVEQLYIDPGKCVNCGACLDACPVAAIYEDAILPDRWKHYARLNLEFFQQRKTPS